jgi:hypothetical protein
MAVSLPVPPSIDPVADEIFAIVPPGLALPNPRHAAIPAHRAAEDLSDRAGVDLRLVAQVVSLVAALRTGDDREALGAREFAELDHATAPGGVDGDRLLDEDVLSRFDSRGEVQRPEIRRRCHRHKLRVALHHFAVGVESREAPLRGH